MRGPRWRREPDESSLAGLLDAAEEAVDAGDAENGLRLATRAERLARRDGVADAVAAAQVARAAALHDLGRFAEATAAAVEACGLAPDDAAAWAERGEAAYRQARFEEARAAFAEVVRIDPLDADGWSRLARVCVWQGDRDRAREAFVRAARLEPEMHVVPVRIAPGEFDRLAHDVWRSIPSAFRDRLGNSLVVAEELPDVEDVAEGFDPDTLGVYEGSTALGGGDLPERIVLFQRNHEAVCANLGDLHEEIRRTVLHEVGHHFGMEEEELPY